MELKDIVDLMDSLKNKVIDAAHVEIFKSAYEAQSKVVDQLKHHNELLEKQVVLYKE